MNRLRLACVLVLFVAALGLEFTRLVIKPWPPEAFDDPVMRFKYGSIGAEVNGYPFLIWQELPSIFSEKVPNEWKDFGFISEEGRDLPIGVSVRRYGVRRVGFNCATCHTSTVSHGGGTTLVLGAPANQLDLQSYLRFLQRVSTDAALTADAVFASAEAAGRPIGWFNRLVFRYYVFPRLSDETSGLAATLAWMNARPAHGPGRTDAGNFWRARWGLHPERDELVGAVDFPSVWNQRAREHGWFHWDGNNSSLSERNLSAALAGGAAEWLLERRAIGLVADWLKDLPPPSFPGPIDMQRAETGEQVYMDEGCGVCHDETGGLVGEATELGVLGTDPERSDLFTPEMVEYFGTVGELYSWQFSHYRSTNGYVNMPLDGIWARAPYLHNGSVPSLEALLSPSEERPARFFSGCGTYDTQTVGFDCADGFEFDTQLRGNSNRGHNFGVSRTPDEKSALIEYLKTR